MPQVLCRETKSTEKKKKKKMGPILRSEQLRILKNKVLWRAVEGDGMGMEGTNGGEAKMSMSMVVMVMVIGDLVVVVHLVYLSCLTSFGVSCSLSMRTTGGTVFYVGPALVVAVGGAYSQARLCEKVPPA